MPYKFYIVLLDSGSILGTNNREIAETFAESEDYFVLEASTGMWIQPWREYVEIKDIGDAQ